MYKVAVEYYIHEDPKKAGHFQRKLTTLLSNPQTLKIMENTQSAKEELKGHEYQRQLKNELGLFHAQSQVVVEQMIEGSARRI